MKKVLIALGILIGLVLAAAIVVPLVVDVDKYRPRIVELANERLNGKLELGKLSLSLWGQVRVEVGGLALSDPSGRKVVAVKDAFFHLPFASIFSGSPSIVFQMHKPEVNLIKNKAGKLNAMSLLKPSEAEPEAAAKPAPKGGGAIALPAIATQARFTVELRDALVNYKDEATGLDTHVRNFNLVLRDISLSRTTDIEMWADLDTTLGKDFKLKGPARLTGKAKPEVSGGKFERVALTAKADLDGVEIQVPGMFEKKAGIDANAALSVSASPKEARIESMDVRFFNAQVKGQGAITNLGAETSAVVQFAMKSNDIELKPWVQLVPMLKEYDLGGKASFNGEAKGPADKLAYGGELRIAALTAKAPKLKAQPQFDGLVRIATDQVEDISLAMKAPGNDLKIQGKVVSFTAPKATFEIVSTGMDLDQLVEFPKKAAEAAPAAGASPAAGGGAAKTTATGGPAADFDAMLAPLRENKMMEAMTAQIGMKLKFIKAYNVNMTDIGGTLTLKELVAKLDKFSMKLWNGSIQAGASMNLRPKVPTYSFNSQVANLQLQEAVASQFHLLRNTLLGKASFEMSGEGASFNPDPAIGNLKGKGKLKVTDATFATIDIGKMATEAINGAIGRIGEKLPPLKDKKITGLPGGQSRYELVSTDFTISGGRFEAPNFVGKAVPNQGLDLKGSVSVGMKDYSLKTAFEIVDTYNLLKARDISVETAGVRVEHVLAEGNGPVRFPVNVGCTLLAPCYSYTEVPEFLGKIALNNAAQAATGKAKSELKKKAESLIPKSAPAPVQDAIKKLFGR